MAGAQPNQQSSSKNHDEQVTKFLQFLDKRDKEYNKQLMKMKINKETSLHNGQKNW